MFNLSNSTILKLLVRKPSEVRTDLKLGGWVPLDHRKTEFVVVSRSKVIRGHSRSNDVKWGKHWCMDMKLGTVVGIGLTRFAAHVARPSGGSEVIQGSKKVK